MKEAVIKAPMAVKVEIQLLKFRNIRKSKEKKVEKDDE
jgi:hypothetical protein